MEGARATVTSQRSHHHEPLRRLRSNDDPALVVTLPNGKGQVRGIYGLYGRRMFRGIPFAAPPLGALRFANPQPHAKWTDVLARQDSAEHFSRLKVQRCTGTGWIFIPAYCFAIP